MLQQNGSLLLFKQIVFSSNLILLAIALFSFIMQRYWIGDHIGNLRLKYLVSLLIIAVILVIFRDYLQLIFCILAIAINGIYVVPLFFPHKTMSNLRPSQDLQITTINVNVGNKNFAAVKYAILHNDSDIVVLQEVGDGLYKNLRNLKNIYPFINSNDKKNYRRIVMLSKIPLVRSNV